MKCKHYNEGACKAVCSRCGHTCEWHDLRLEGGKCLDTVYGGRYEVACTCAGFVEWNE